MIDESAVSMWPTELRALLSRRSVVLLPEIELWLASEVYELWKVTEALSAEDKNLPYWAFAWAGGQALARYVLDHPELVRGQHVLDLGAGSGVVGIAASASGAIRVTCVDPDAFAQMACLANAELNQALLEVVGGVEEVSTPVDIVLAGDIFYDREMSRSVFDDLKDFVDRGAKVLSGDPSRGFAPRGQFRQIASYDVAVMAVVEEHGIKKTGIFELSPEDGDEGAA